MIAIAEEMDSKEFTCSDLEKAITSVTSSNSLVASHTLLNRLAKDNYLKKERSDGRAFVHDTEAKEDQKSIVLNDRDLKELVEQVENRENIEAETDPVSWENVGEIISEINNKVGRPVLTIRAEPNRYTLTDKAIRIIKSNL